MRTNLDDTFLKELTFLAELWFSFLVLLNHDWLVTDSYAQFTVRAQSSLSKRLVQVTLLHRDLSWRAQKCFKMIGAPDQAKLTIK